MPTVHPGATLVPHFRDFLPPWVSVRPWYLGGGVPTLTPLGYLRMEDPAGEVGIETHLVTDGTTTYQIPMTYRPEPIDAPLIATAHHSALGPRWIYDATGDPVWRTALLHLVRTGATTAPSAKRGVLPATATGHPSAAFHDDQAVIDLLRVPAEPPTDGSVGVVRGTWAGSGGCLAIVREL